MEKKNENRRKRKKSIRGSKRRRGIEHCARHYFKNLI